MYTSEDVEYPMNHLNTENFNWFSLSLLKSFFFEIEIIAVQNI